MQFKDNVVIVTGGASGLGGATSKLIVDAGGKVLIADVNAAQGEKTAAELGANAKFVKCDVTSEADGQAAVDAAVGMGRLVGLVNCAGVGIAMKTVGKDGAHPLALGVRGQFGIGGGGQDAAEVANPVPGSRSLRAHGWAPYGLQAVRACASSLWPAPSWSTR